LDRRRRRGDGGGLFATGAAACDLHAIDAAKAGKGCAQAWMDRNLHLNDLMTVGTHNSYHVRTPEKIMALIRAWRRRRGWGWTTATRRCWSS